MPWPIHRRLDERERRLGFLAEHGLLNMRKVQALDRRRTGNERDTHARLRVFARYRCEARVRVARARVRLVQHVWACHTHSLFRSAPHSEPLPLQQLHCALACVCLGVQVRMHARMHARLLPSWARVCAG